MKFETDEPVVFTREGKAASPYNLLHTSALQLGTLARNKAMDLQIPG